MTRDFSGKTLLVLGAYSTERQIVECAQRMGIKVVVTDNHTDWKQAPAKYIADEAWNISWSEIDVLAEMCRQSGIDGVMAGFSERRVACAERLCQVLGLPFYSEGADTATIFDKAKFRKACQEAGVDVVRSYEQGEKVDFPVIVKPSDNGGSKGISICWNEDELAEGLAKAKGNSDAGVAVIEEYVVADEVMIYYVVHNGIPTLSAMCDRYMKSFDPRITQLPIGYRFPSKHLAAFEKRHDEGFKRLIKSLGIRNGLIAFQSFAKDGRVIPFDPTFRLDGTMAYEATKALNDSSALEMLISCSLTGSMGDDLSIERKEDPDFDRIAFELPVLLGRGELARYEGFDEVGSIDGVYFSFSNAKVGDVMSHPADFSQMLCRVQLLARDERDLETKLDTVFGTIVAEDPSSHDMVLYRNAAELASGKVERCALR